MWIDEEVFYKVFKEHPELFPEWVDEGSQIWNRETGEIICENGTLMHDAVYRGNKRKNYNDYWKNCFQEQPKAINGGPEAYRVTLSYEDIENQETYDQAYIAPDNFEINVTYKVIPVNKEGLYKDIRYININTYCPTINFDDNYTDDWYSIWGVETDEVAARKIYDTHTFEECRNFIYDYFYVVGEISD